MKKRTTISRQMAFRSGMLSAISVLIVIIVSIFILRENLIRDNNERLILEAQTYQDEIENWIDNIVEPMNIVVQTIRKTDIKDDNEKLLNYLKDVTLGFNEAIPEGMYVANSDNELIDPTGFILDSDIIIAEREWFALGLTSENLVLGDPYYGVNLDIGAMVSASARIDEKTVACMDIVLTSIVEKVKTIDVIGDGYSFLLDKSTGYILAHPNSEYSGKKIYEIEDEFILQAFAKASEAEENIYTLEDRGTSYLVKGNAIDDTDWMFFTCAQKAVIMDALSRAQVIYGIVAIVVTIASVIVIAMLIRITLKPVQDITRVVEKITTGDFSEKAVISGNNEITTLSEYLNTYIDQMRHTISRLFTISDYLKQQSENSEESSVAMLQSTSAQKDSMQQMNTTIDEMARSIEEVAESASALASKVSKINGNSNDATDKIINTVTDTENGKRDIEKVAVTITNIDGVMNELSVVVSEVGESMKAINAVTDIIGGIASQTNLLALNASIEAARAGEAGKGFAVVATEIGNLAAMCASSVNQIGSLVGKIQMQVGEVVTKTTVSAQDVALSRKLIDDTQKSFEKIYESINGTKELIADVTEKIMEVDEVTTAIAAITEEESAGAEEIVANSESLFEQAVLIEENSENVREVAQNLGAHAKEIYEQIAHFKL